MPPLPSASILPYSNPVLILGEQLQDWFKFYPKYGQPQSLLSTIPDLWLWTAFVDSIGFNSAKASCLPREGEKEGHLGILTTGSVACS